MGMRKSDENLKKMPVKEQSKILGKQWREIDSTTKDKYTQDYRKLRKVYDDEMKVWLTTPEGIEDTEKRKGSRPKAASAYNVFVKREYQNAKQENPEMNFGEITQVLSKKWKNMNSEDKDIYEQAAKELNANKENEGTQVNIE